MARDQEEILQDLVRVAAVERMLLERFRIALDASVLDDIGQLDAKLTRVGSDRQRLSAELSARGSRQADRASPTVTASVPPVASGRSRALRDIILATLDAIGVPLPPALLSEIARVTTGADIPASRFSSLRRDDERAARRNPTARPTWLAPAIDAATLAPMPRLLTSSAWSAERRMIAPSSLHIFHLRTISALLDRSAHLAPIDAAVAAEVEAIAQRLARDVPGAAGADAARIRAAVAHELQPIVADDRAARIAAAARLAGMSAPQQLWGVGNGAGQGDA